MFNSPIAQALSLFIGAYSLLVFLGKFKPLDTVVTAIAGGFCLTLWMLRYHRAQLYTFYQNPVLGPVIDFVCKVTKEQPPVDASVDDEVNAAQAGRPVTEVKPKEPEEKSRLALRSQTDFSASARNLKDVVIGHDEVIEAVMEQLYQNVQLRESSARAVSLPPLGLFLFVGKNGLGKRRLGTEIGRSLYKSGAIVTLDAMQEGAGALLISAVKANPYAAIILENIQAASPQLKNELKAVFAGAPLVESATGSKVSFRHCVFFLLLHRDASLLPKPERKKITGTGQTVVVSALKSLMDIDEYLAWTLHGAFPFVLPSKIDQARVVALLMQEECRKYKLRLGYIDPGSLAREVEVSEAQGGFQLTPSRVAKVLSDRIFAAVAAKEEYIELGTETSDTRQVRYDRSRR